MKKRTIKLAIAGAIAIIGTIGYNFSVNQNDANFQFTMDNVDALARGEGTDTGGDCNMYLSGKTDEMLTYMNAKNKLGGLAAGCRKKCGHICTVKNSPDISIEF